jgi:hypothetical protein
MQSWVLPTVLVFVVIVLAFKLAGRRTPAEAALLTKRLEERNLTSQRFYLETLRRELANSIMNESLEVFEATFLQMCSFENELHKSDANRWHAEQSLLLQKYPNLEDFDLIGVRHFVRHNDRRNRLYDCDDMVERYKEISKFMIVNRMHEFQLPGQRLYNEDERESFIQTIRSEKNRRLRTAIEEGVRRYRSKRSALIDQRDISDMYDDNEYYVTYLTGMNGRPFSPENEYGVYCKKLNEYGIFSFFSSDGDKFYESYYRSDRDFEPSTDRL